MTRSSLAALALLISGCEWVLPYAAGPSPRGDAAQDTSLLAGDPRTTPDSPRPGDCSDINLPDLPRATRDGSSDLSAAKDGGPDAWRLRITTDPILLVGSKSTYSYQAKANATPVTWSLPVAPTGMTVDTAGLVSWAPAAITSYPVTLRASDGVQTADQSYTLQVVGGSMNGLHPADLRGLIRNPALRALAAHPLQDRLLAPEVRRQLADPATARALAYVVGCALDAGDDLHVRTRRGTVALRGALGLASEWRRKHCGSRCQEWVSACVAARVNAEGAPIPVLLAVRAVSLPGQTEGAFFGNMFTDRPQLASCRARQASSPLPRGRRCTVDRDACWPVWPAGDCEDVCEGGEGSCRAPGSASWTRATTVILP